MSGMLDLMLAGMVKPDQQAGLKLQSDVKQEAADYAAEMEKKAGRIGGWGTGLSIAGGLLATALTSGVASPLLAAAIAGGGAGLGKLAGNAAGGLYDPRPDVGKFNVAGDKASWDSYKNKENIDILTKAATAAALNYGGGQAADKLGDVTSGLLAGGGWQEQLMQSLRNLTKQDLIYASK